MTKQDFIMGGEGAARGGWLKEEPLGWVLATMALGAGAALGCWCVWAAARELLRRWKEKKSQGRKIEG